MSNPRGGFPKPVICWFLCFRPAFDLFPSDRDFDRFSRPDPFRASLRWWWWWICDGPNGRTRESLARTRPGNREDLSHTIKKTRKSIRRTVYNFGCYDSGPILGNLCPDRISNVSPVKSWRFFRDAVRTSLSDPCTSLHVPSNSRKWLIYAVTVRFFLFFFYPRIMYIILKIPGYALLLFFFFCFCFFETDEVFNGSEWVSRVVRTRLTFESIVGGHVLFTSISVYYSWSMCERICFQMVIFSKVVPIAVYLYL